MFGVVKQGSSLLQSKCFVLPAATTDTTPTSAKACRASASDRRTANSIPKEEDTIAGFLKHTLSISNGG